MTEKMREDHIRPANEVLALMESLRAVEVIVVSPGGQVITATRPSTGHFATVEIR